MKHDIIIIDKYIQLAAAIVNSGIAAHDEDFLKSEWCRVLTEAVIDFHNTDLYPDIKNIYLPNKIF